MDVQAQAHQERFAVIAQEQIAEFLQYLQDEGRAKASIERYQYNLNTFYAALPDSKKITQRTLPLWREALLRDGFAVRTVNQRLSTVSSFLNFLNLREFQLSGAALMPEETEVTPELSRAEYLQLLRTAKQMDNERDYLLVKIFVTTGIPVQCLEALTVPAVKRGQFAVVHKNIRQTITVPKSMQEELLDYARRNVNGSGPVFLSRTGKPLHRTYINAELRRLCDAAHVPEVKGNPRCLRRLYMKTQQEIEDSVRALVEQSYNRMLETEQMTTGWNV